MLTSTVVLIKKIMQYYDSIVGYKPNIQGEQMSNRKSVTLRAFVENTVKGTSKKGANTTERRRNVVAKAIEAASKGTVRRQDGARYANTESVRVYATRLFNEIAG